MTALNIGDRVTYYHPCLFDGEAVQGTIKDFDSTSNIYLVQTDFDVSFWSWADSLSVQETQEVAR